MTRTGRNMGIVRNPILSSNLETEPRHQQTQL